MENRTLGKQAYEYLKRRILSNEFMPGERLREVELAKSLMISRAPVREALQVLAAEGMVTINPRRGTYVAKLDPQEYLEYVQVREALESLRDDHRKIQQQLPPRTIRTADKSSQPLSI